MARKRKALIIQQEEKIINKLMDTRNAQVKALQKVLNHLTEENKKKVC